MSNALRPVAQPFDILGAGFLLHSLRMRNVVFFMAASTRTFYVNVIDAASGVGPIPTMLGIGYSPS